MNAILENIDAGVKAGLEKARKNSVREKLLEAKQLLSDAEHEWGQPLYYDEEGFSQDPQGLIDLTIEGVMSPD